MKIKNIITILYISTIAWMTFACSKKEFLEKKPNSGIIIPTSLEELRWLLDNTNIFTFSPGLGELSADNYYLSSTNWLAANLLERNAYSWEKDLYASIRQNSDWSVPYQQVLYANIVLEQCEKIKPLQSEQPLLNDIKGSALFLRAYAFTSLLQHFAPAYHPQTATTQLGIPLRTSTDINKIFTRSSLKQGFDQVETDLATAVRLLSLQQPITEKNRPSKAAAYGLLARVCLYTKQYDRALLFADSSLQLYRSLIDYNTISATAVTPFPRSNDETIYYCQANNYSLLQTISAVAWADTTLYRSYATNDLRRNIFFRSISGNDIGFKRGYSGTVFVFTGLATDEIYLIRAEAYARAGNTQAAMTDINTLLAKRFRIGTFQPLTAINANDALNKVLTERRKELVWRGHRWLDLKRFNSEGASISLIRVLNGNTITLPPNSPLYTLPIPAEEIEQSQIQQNPR